MGISYKQEDYEGLPENASTENASTGQCEYFGEYGKCEYGICEYV